MTVKCNSPCIRTALRRYLKLHTLSLQLDILLNTISAGYTLNAMKHMPTTVTHCYKDLQVTTVSGIALHGSATDDQLGLSNHSICESC